MQEPRYACTLIALHALDPFGSKVGGIETHVRQVIRYRPRDTRIILVGVDDSGTRKLGQLYEITDDAGSYWFMPILHCHTIDVNKAARHLWKSLTLRFFCKALYYLPRLRLLAREMPTTLDLQRYEYAWLGQLIGVPFVLTTHGDMKSDSPMDSLLKSVPFLHYFNERHAVQHAAHIYSVNQEQTRRLKTKIPGAAHKTEFMTVSVDDRLFRPTPYIGVDGPLQIAFVGRLDQVKRPGMMFDVVRRVHEASPTGAQFHYVGAADPEAYSEFDAIRQITTRHGFRSSAEIADLWQGWHIGLITSVFEGMPVYALEAICAGRPVCSVHLPQMHLVIKDTISGLILDTNNDSPDLAQRLADAILSFWQRIRDGALDPAAVNDCVTPYKASSQMSVIYERHRTILAQGKLYK